MGYAVGIAVALVVCTFARTVGFDRDRAFYPTVLVVIASYYVLFAVMGGSTRALALESVAMSAFVLFAVAGFKRNLWLVAAGLAAHGVFDFFHSQIVNNPGVPGRELSTGSMGSPLRRCFRSPVEWRPPVPARVRLMAPTSGRLLAPWSATSARGRAQ
jgi:hypothetical protein